jgi:hypothetical protein
MIWRAMYGSGVLIGMVQVITQSAQVLIQPGLQQEVLALSAGAAGTMLPGTAGFPAAAAATARTSAVPSAGFVFVWTKINPFLFVLLHFESERSENCSVWAGWF